ncbi:hypothetical protein [Coralloluteibacterium thermophilus]|uniref:Uncharacterized protein n=1 Tax=Coralloluteibacterium thermophilum TaxID=2707049 RepID=A0ABV9NPP2_9GAMM
MATLPSYVDVRMSSWSEAIKPNVEVVEMERGPDKYRVLNSRATVRMSCALLFRTTQDDLDFLDWYFDVIEQVNYFTMTHPRTGQQIQARFVHGDIGEVRSISGTDGLWQRDAVIEYMK